MKYSHPLKCSFISKTDSSPRGVTLTFSRTAYGKGGHPRYVHSEVLKRPKSKAFLPVLAADCASVNATEHIGRLKAAQKDNYSVSPCAQF